MGKALRKAFRILGLGETKGKWLVEQDFHGNFRVKITWPFSPVSLTELCLFWCGFKALFTLHTLTDKVVLER